ncbi:MAG TPA: AbrB/MazE/SpoVT family DNA-binding domain-containing protein [Chloroflexota bacterium]|nr:AbrB/MazE/SpoVT family DNA-binding domain-containing protein [Chloroflexota bacterium]
MYKVLKAPKKVGEATLSGRGLVNLPAKAMRELGWKAGDKVIVEIVDENIISLVRKPENFAEAFAGKLTDVFGDHEETLAYLEGERRSWDSD